MFGPDADIETNAAGQSSPAAIFSERIEIMAEFTSVFVQQVAAGQNVAFTETPVSGSNCIVHRDGAGIVTLRGRPTSAAPATRSCLAETLRFPLAGQLARFPWRSPLKESPWQRHRHGDPRRSRRFL